MDRPSRSDRMAAMAVALLLLLTAWGNAVVMLVMAALGVVVAAIFLGRSSLRGGALSATVGFVLAIASALITLLP